MIDRKFIGHQLQPSVLTVDRTRLQFFAKAIGEKDPIYTDRAAAQAAGYADVPAPPTFLFAAELDSGANDQLLVDLTSRWPSCCTASSRSATSSRCAPATR